MRHFKDAANNRIMAFDDDAPEEYINEEWIELHTQEEIDATHAEFYPVVINKTQVITERTRRLSTGFSYDFGDARGVHLIGTTEQDHKGWDEVSKLSTAAILANAPETVITLKTETGIVDVTAQEWQSIVIAIGQWSQTFYQASFAIQAMDPIPSDYTNDSYWPSS